LILVGFLFFSERTTGPVLQAFMQEAVFGPGPPSGETASPSTICVIIVALANSGTGQSAATSFQLTAKIKRNVYQGNPQGAPPIFDLKLPEGHRMGAAMRFYSTDWLYNKAATPIPPGGMIFGFLLYTFPPIDYKTLVGQPMDLTLTFQDAFGKIYSVSSSSEKPTEDYVFHIHPGVKMEIIPRAEGQPPEQKAK
jgi:hypothetical protein